MVSGVHILGAPWSGFLASLEPRTLGFVVRLKEGAGGLLMRDLIPQEELGRARVSLKHALPVHQE